MPALAVDARRILVGVDPHQGRIVAHMGGGGMDVQFAEFSAEGEMLFRGDVLVAEKDHEMFGQRAVDLVDLAVGARSPETSSPISTPDISAPMIGVSFSTPMVS